MKYKNIKIHLIIGGNQFPGNKLTSLVLIKSTFCIFRMCLEENGENFRDKSKRRFKKGKLSQSKLKKSFLDADEVRRTFHTWNA